MNLHMNPYEIPYESKYESKVNIDCNLDRNSSIRMFRIGGNKSPYTIAISNVEHNTFTWFLKEGFLYSQVNSFL